MTDRLPPGWAVVGVDDLVSSSRDVTDGPFGSNLKTEHYTADGAFVVRLQNIGDGEFIHAPAYISLHHFEHLRKHDVQSGDVVVAMLGADLPRACVVPQSLGPAIVKADCVRLRPDGAKADSRYVSWCLNSSVVREQAEELVHGVGRPRLGLKWFRMLRLPLAPPPEQKRIIDVLESYLSRLDAAIASLERVQAKLKAYRASVLKAAVEGRLVRTEAELARQEKREYEPASMLLRRILEERRRRWEEAELARLTKAGKAPKDDRWKAKYEEPEALDTSTLPQLPEGWCWAPAAAFYWDGGYGTSEKCAEKAEGPAVLRIPNVVDGRVTLEDLKYCEMPGSLADDGAVEPGDFLFVRTNGSKALVGKGALVTERFSEPHYFASYLIRLRLVTCEDVSTWFALVWNSWMVRNQLLIVAASSAGQHNVSLSSAAGFSVALAPSLEQGRILAEVSRLLSTTEAVECEVSKNLVRNRRLRQSILKWAFEGKLVDQDPTDEPAEQLLARIRAERAATAPEPKRPRAAKSPRKKKVTA
jgi:type I restriction enzyme, S subunit